MHDLVSLSWTSIASSHNFSVYALIFTIANFKFILHRCKYDKKLSCFSGTKHPKDPVMQYIISKYKVAANITNQTCNQ